MGARAEQLAKQLEEANAEIIATVESVPDAKWRSARTAPEGWTVNVVAHHVGDGHHGVSQLVQGIANGQTLPPLTMEMIDQGNAKHAQEFAGCDKAEALKLLRENGAAAAAAVRGLSDEQLDRSGPVIGNSMSAQQAIEFILIGHVKQHNQSIKDALKG